MKRKAVTCTRTGAKEKPDSKGDIEMSLEHNQKSRKISSTKTAEEQRKTTEEKKYACQICDKFHTSEKSLRIHIKQHQNSRSFVCQTCGKGFTRKYHLSRHEPTHRKAAVKSASPDDWENWPTLKHQQPSTKQPNQKYLCKVCNNIFSNPKSLKVHYKKHLGQRYSCSSCDKSFTSSNGLKLHKLSHDGQKPWICGTCGKQFRTKAHLTRHEKTHVPGVPSNICEVCGKGFHSRQSLKVHMGSHNESKQFQCPVCGSCFKYKTSLDIHSRIHKKDKDFKCHLCNRSFAQKKTLQHHLGVHERVKERNGYILPPSEFCELCGKGLATKAGLRKHMKKHKDGSLKIFNRLNNSKFSLIKEKVSEETEKGGKHPHEVEVYSELEKNVQFEVLLNESFSDFDDDNDGCKNGSNNETPSLSQLEVNKSKHSKQKNKVIKNRITPKDSEKHRPENQVSEDNDKYIKTFQGSREKVPEIDDIEGENTSERNDDLQEMIKSIEDLIVIVQDKDQDKSKQNSEAGNAISATDDVEINSEIQGKFSNSVRNEKDQLSSYKKETILEGLEQSNNTGDENVEDNASDGAYKDKRVDSFKNNQPFHNIYGSVSSHSDKSDSLSDDGELYIHFEYDSDATNAIQDINDGGGDDQERETREIQNSESQIRNSDFLPTSVQNINTSATDATRQSFSEDVSISSEVPEILQDVYDEYGHTKHTNDVEDNKITSEQDTTDVATCVGKIRPRTQTVLHSEHQSLKKECYAKQDSARVNKMIDMVSTHKLFRDHSSRLKCDCCVKYFNRSGDLTKHLKKEHPEKFKVHSENNVAESSKRCVGGLRHDEIKARKDPSYSEGDRKIKTKDICDLCNKEFKQHSYFRKHMRMCHPEKEIIYKCLKESCDELFKSKLTFKRHLKSHQVTTCQLCDKDFNNTNELVSHVLNTHDSIGDSSVSTQKCMICNDEFEEETFSYNHLKTHMVSKVTVKESTGKSYECEICGKKFQQRQSLKRHHVLHGDSVDRPECDHCGKVFVQQGHLQRHLKAQACSKDVSCTICNEGFHTDGQLRSHIQKRHQLPAYKCPYCPKQFKSSSSMQRHKRFHVDGTEKMGEFKPYMCNICGKCYTAAHTLSVHMLLHTNARPYKCDFCRNSYTQRAHLQRHVAVAHKGIKRFKCDVAACGKTFADNGALQAHKRVHSGEKPYKCGQCGKSFSQQSILRCHQNTHKDVKDHQCQYCSQLFSTKASAQRHIGRHVKSVRLEVESSKTRVKTKPRPVVKMADKLFKCELCDKKFTTQRATVVHTKKYCSLKGKYDSTSNSHGRKSEISNIIQVSVLPSTQQTNTTAFQSTGNDCPSTLASRLDTQYIPNKHQIDLSTIKSDQLRNPTSFCDSTEGGNAIRKALTGSPVDFPTLRPQSVDIVSPNLVHGSVIPAINILAPVESYPHLVMMSNVQLHGSYQ